MNPNPLDQLKDIHLPTEVSWWPIAPGWWLLALLVLLVLFTLWKLWRKSRQASQRYQQIVTAVDELEADSQLDEKEWLAALSALLRRLAINLDGRQQSAGLVGKEWLAYLDKQGNTQAFTQGVGQVLASSPYQASVDYNRKELLTLVRRWLKVQSRRGPTHA
ncbi:DUF4381 domain-containing protein [Leucothrix pacifica]|uniref:DUF4381 domain-containing protein n=1 Tax=Leucothrix pacifica TaxID=1247513 RepID=A0A317CN95_9GAMM|nr:DUF4381 domain-containing protein [Leucothrix pacifica]PWR00019.1 DUF4381 domain-containing protein [Leucothrix pacifica]